MANIADYLPGGEKDPSQAGGIDDEITQAGNQQQARVNATPEVNWEDRYKELEKLNSRQAQDLGTYRKMVDEYITAPTPATPVVEEVRPITVDDLYDNPDEAVNRAVESHPAIQEARQIKESMERQLLEDSMKEFQTRHPDYHEIGADPAFRNWVEEDHMRQELYQRGNSYDLSAADALFSLYKAENNVTQMTTEAEQQQQIAAVNLEDSSSVMVNEAPKYSRSEYVDTLMRARQGDLTAERWVERNAAGYRLALASGNVRD
jgi:hypothetical protein